MSEAESVLSMDGLFAGTPPLEAFRYLIHEAATVRPKEKIGCKVLMLNDVARGTSSDLS